MLNTSLVSLTEICDSSWLMKQTSDRSQLQDKFVPYLTQVLLRAKVINSKVTLGNCHRHGELRTKNLNGMRWCPAAEQEHLVETEKI